MMEDGAAWVRVWWQHTGGLRQIPCPALECAGILERGAEHQGLSPYQCLVLVRIRTVTQGHRRT